MTDIATPSPTLEGGGQDESVVEQQVAPGGAAAAGGSGEAASAPGEVAAPAPKTRQRKETLPGVVARDDSDDLFPDLGFKSNKKQGRISRDEALRELEAEMKDEGNPDFLQLPKEEGDEAPVVEEKPPTPSKIKFADKEYESLQAIEQEFKSLRGMFKPLQQRVEEAETREDKAIDLARQWRAKAMSFEGVESSPTPQRQVPPASTQAQPSNQNEARAELDAALANVNGELFEKLAREDGLPLAGRYLAAQVLATVHDTMLPRLRDEIMAQIQPELEISKQERGFQEATQHVSSLLETVATYKNTDGSDAFPELNDPQTVYEIGDLWRSMEMPADVALTNKGLLQAIALYRMYNPGGRQAVTSTPSVEVSRPSATAPSSASQSLEGAPAPSPIRGRESEETRFGRTLDDAPLVDRTLGFAVRRRR